MYLREHQHTECISGTINTHRMYLRDHHTQGVSQGPSTDTERISGTINTHKSVSQGPVPFHAATKRQSSRITRTISPSLSILTPGQPVLVLALQSQDRGKLTAGAAVVKPQGMTGHGKAGFDPRVRLCMGRTLNHWATVTRSHVPPPRCPSG